MEQKSLQNLFLGNFIYLFFIGGLCLFSSSEHLDFSSFLIGWSFAVVQIFFTKKLVKGFLTAATSTTGPTDRASFSTSEGIKRSSSQKGLSLRIVGLFLIKVLFIIGFFFVFFHLINIQVLAFVLGTLTVVFSGLFMGLKEAWHAS